MTRPTSHLESVLDRLPFSVDDTEAANEAYRRWIDRQHPKDKRLVDMWTYCYVSRYFLSKSTAGDIRSAADADKLQSKTYEKIENKREKVRNPDRYAHWVSVVCKNAFLNYVRRRRVAESVDAEGGPTLVSKTTSTVADMGFVKETLVDAIDQLPNYLQEPARLYFLEHKDFEEISDEIEKPVPTVRTYKHKATKRLRKNDRLREYVDRLDV
ncbi:MAG: RNA polymerase sigma factor [Salinivenus sp.]